MIFISVVVGLLVLAEIFTFWQMRRGRRVFWAAMKSFEAELKQERKMRELLGKRLFRVQDSWSDHLEAHKAEKREKERRGETEEGQDEPSSG